MESAKPRRVKPSRRFLKDLKRADARTRVAAARALRNFLQDPNIPGLNFEKLKGEKDLWSIRVNDNFRILLRESEDDEGSYFLATHMASHDVYKRL